MYYNLVIVILYKFRLYTDLNLNLRGILYTYYILILKTNKCMHIYIKLEEKFNPYGEIYTFILQFNDFDIIIIIHIIL